LAADELADRTAQRLTGVVHDIDIASEGGAAERIKVIRSSLAQGSGTPGTALDDTLTIACGEGAVRLVEVQRAGRKAMSAAEFLRGFPVPKGRALAVG